MYKRQPQGTPFGPSTFDKAGPTALASSARLSLDIRCEDKETEAFFTELDAFAPKYLAEHSERIFGKRMSLEQVTNCYRPCLRKREGYAPLLHTKVSLEGPYATHFWDENKDARDPPANWRDARMLFQLSIPHLWFSGGLCGFVINILDCQIMSEDGGRAPPVCPF